MSELKAFNCVDSDLQEFCEPRLVYIKSEADKVIAEKDAEIAKLKSLKQALMADDLRYRDKIRRQKYKRCMLIVKDYIQDVRYFTNYMNQCGGGYDAYVAYRIRKLKIRLEKWTEIADKFKE